jgi:chromosome partitioning protein
MPRGLSTWKILSDKLYDIRYESILELGLQGKPHRMKIVTLLAQKGGTGKTTLSIHLAVLAAARGMRVVIADIDPQRSAGVWKKRREEDSPDVISLKADVLKKAIGDYKKQGVDLLVIDTAPHSHDDAIIAARAADFILIPSRPAILDLEAIGTSVDIVKGLAGKAAIVLNGCPFPGKNGERAIVVEAREALGGYGLPVSPAAISNRVALSHSLIGGQAVTEFESDGKAAAEIRELMNWINEEVGLW